MLPSDANFTTLRPVRKASVASVAKYRARLRETAWQDDCDALAGPVTMVNSDLFCANIENFIGTVKIPVGIIGPLPIKGLNTNGDFHAPMATTEAACVAFHARGAYAATRSGGIVTASLYEGVIRTPAFVFNSLLDAGLFVE